MEGVGRPNAWELEVGLPALSAAMARASEWLSCRDQVRDLEEATQEVLNAFHNYLVAPRGAWPVN